ncbi:MAG: cell wall-binding repeat-containing protein, partial [Candidatus Thermoplasmatota archaeon]|nr:cell wall-binding repeat-containing protein [Candidatus Thermoplasmatota archaeon]
VNFDEESYLDDYAYLSAVPTTVFNNGEKLFSYPLLFYQDEYPINDYIEKSLNAREGIDYFMEDWMGYCNGQLDQMTLINVPKQKLDSSWKAKQYNLINGENPYDIANQLALQDWSYSDNAVIAVIQDQFENLKIKNTTYKIQGVIPSSKIRKEPTFELKQTNSFNPVFHEFTVPEGYKYILAEAWWNLLFSPALLVMIPTGDPDLQLYCKKDDFWMQSTASSKWNVLSGYQGREYTHTRVYNPGPWRISITDVPTKGSAPAVRGGPLGIFKLQGSLLKALLPKVTYYVDVTMYPGIDIKLPENPPFGCRNAEFTLKWNNPQVNLGFSLIGPSGEVILTEVNQEKTGFTKMHINQLGECLNGENYTICVFALNDVYNIDFEIEYSWQQNMTKDESFSLTSATEGAVLASTLNAPLLYVSNTKLQQKTVDVLYKLGVENIYIVDLGGGLSKSLKEELENIATIKEYYKEPKQIYNAICNITNSNDVIFSTVDPWTYWYIGFKYEDIKPAGETKAGLFIGPAAYVAAHHGAPVLIIDNHPELSSAVVWHNEFWRRYSGSRLENEPSVAEMVLTGKRIYNFLKEYGFDKPGPETIITVADQYDIGVSWDRIFPGAANPGRFCGSPVDTAYWISRNIFYPVLIFENPAINGKVSLINGSISSRQGIRGLFKKPFLNTLVIKKDSQEEEFEYPVLCSFIGYEHRFNERASKYYGMKYQTADGLIPGETVTLEAIDQGSIKKYTGKDGSYFPDISLTDVLPFYLEKGGYDVVYSTKLEAVTDNLNKGVILWNHASHGNEQNGGSTLFWDPATKFKQQSFVIRLLNRFFGTVKEDNPWRGYEWYLGSTEEPDTMSMDIKGAIPFTNIRPPGLPAFGLDWLLSRKPFREMLNKLIPVIDPFKTENLKDGVIGAFAFGLYTYDWKNVTVIESLLKNLHSVGFITSICETSNTYFHLTLIRHGSVFQVQDPWPTSWYGTIWQQSISRDIILGDTVGEAYTKGISHVGILYISEPPQWWWDLSENVVYFGDPDLRMYVPSTKYSDANYWEKQDTKPLKYDAEILINGHMPFGATVYPKEKKPLTFWQQYQFVLIILVIIFILIIIAIALPKKKR